jgi:hypothetical protein
MRRTICLLAVCAITACLAADAETVYPGLTITSTAVAAPAGGRLIIPVFVDNSTDLWVEVFTTSSPIGTQFGNYPPPPPYVDCSQVCIGQDLDRASFTGIKPHSTASGVADEFNWSSGAPVGYDWTGLLDGDFDLSTAYLGPSLVNGAFQIDFRAIVTDTAEAPEPPIWVLIAAPLVALAIAKQTRQRAR